MYVEREREGERERVRRRREGVVHVFVFSPVFLLALFSLPRSLCRTYLKRDR
jgi:hypothetical protein